jgi:hypothetical protein
MLPEQQEAKSPYLKSLPEWLELDYHQRARPLRSRRTWVTLSVAGFALIAVAWSLLPSHHHTHQAGPVATAHAMFNNDCSKCHTTAWQPAQRLWHGDGVRSVPDQACLTCHDGAVHHDRQEHTPACASCHREHRGRPVLARVDDAHCTACHRDLHLRDGAPQFHPHITSFAADHPEFRIFQTGTTQQTLRFSHAGHLELDLASLRAQGRKGLNAWGDQLECASCHQPDREHRYMQPVNHQRHCAGCHPLTVAIAGQFQDAKTRKAAAKFRAEPAPHDQPEIVRGRLRERLLRFVRDNPVLLGPKEPDERLLPGPSSAMATEEEWLWVRGQLKNAEDVLFLNRALPGAERHLFDAAGGCRQCHPEASQVRQPGELPSYRPTKIPPEPRLRHSVFRHDSHRLLTCMQCHPQALTSTDMGRTLLPGVATCQQCHHPEAGARSACAECHRYHDRGKERGLNGMLTIDQCLGK